MARVTVEDCLQYVANRFELVMLAAKRARQLMRGSVEPTVPWENDKPTVVALREIASGHTDFSDAHEAAPLASMILPPAQSPATENQDLAGQASTSAESEEARPDKNNPQHETTAENKSTE